MERLPWNWNEAAKYSPQEEVEQLLYEDEKIKVSLTYSLGQTTEWYDQPQREIVALVEGEAVLEYEWGVRQLSKGDVLVIEPHERHCVAKQSKCIWYCIFEK